MKVVVSVVGVLDDNDQRPTIDWPKEWPIPRVNEEVTFMDHTLWVRHVVWYPAGEPETSDREPFVYLVIGRKIPTY